MASIGGFSFLQFRGPAVLPPAQQLADITRDGVNGHAYQQTGERADSVTIQTTADTNDPAGLASQYKALQGTLQTVVNVSGLSVNNVAVLRVETMQPAPMGLAAGGLCSGAWVLMCRWTLQASGA